MKKTIKNIIITLIIGIVLYYFMLPPINITSPAFWTFVVMLLFVYAMLNLTSESLKENLVINSTNIALKGNPFKAKGAKYTIALIVIIIAGIALINFIFSPLFNANKFANRIAVLDTTDFTTDVAEVDFSSIPLLDKASSQKLGDRKMGQMSDLVSQYVVSNLYTQINYNSDIVRVTPLEYASVIKYFTNRSGGVEGYIIVNSVTGDSDLIRLENGMRYMPSALFGEDLQRHLRFNYPTTIFGDANFEIDNEGKPFWIVPTIKYVGVGTRTEISGVVVVDAVTGDSKKYKVGEVPSWIDHVYEADLIIEQVDHWGEYNGGFFNSIFGQKNVINTTVGYNYLALEDDIYVYTGITSVSTDESNIGFILSNMRTKETHFYSVPGAEEFSAMASAEGLVQEKSYTASFPLLINLNNRPTYLLSLKDFAGLVKMYAFVDVEDYQKVSTSDSSLGINVAAEKYLNDYNLGNTAINNEEKTIKVKSIETAIIDGNTHYYITDSENKNYSVSVKVERNLLPFLKAGDEVEITYSTGNVNNIATIKQKQD